MFVIGLEKAIDSLRRLFFLIGFWHQDDIPTLAQILPKIFYSVYYLFFPISLIAGAITSDNSAESISLVAIALSNITLVVKVYHIIWCQKEILKMINELCVYSVDDRETFTLISSKLKFFIKFFIAFAFSSAALCSIVAHIGYLGRERRLFFNIGFPFDYKTSEIAFWLALAFNSTEEILAVLIIFFSTIVWYLMIHCAFRYEILGYKLRTLGTTKTEMESGFRPAVPKAEYNRELLLCIQSFLDIRDKTNQLESFFSTAFSIQVATSALSICGSIYCLAYKNIDNLVEFYVYLIILLYNVFDTFMVMYFGNEITFHSGKLSYRLFESNWIDQSISCRKAVIIFGEHLREPQKLMIFKVYPLTLQTFTTILRAAYNFFNILSKLAH